MTAMRIGPFEVEAQIGRGGMGVVYRARCLHSRQVVALKMLPEDVSPITWKRFEREIKVVKTLKHPNVVYCYGGRCDDQRRYYAMEYVGNGSLKELLARRGLLNWDEAVEFGLQICSALDYVHARGIVHRDLKPENLLLTNDGQIKLSDFGVALISDGRELTREGSTCGSYSYMAPEQISGSKDVSPRTDLYALGCVLFEMITGRRVFGDKVGPPVLLDHLHVPPPSVLSFAPDCPAPLADLIDGLLEKSPDKRPQNAAVLAQVLKQIVKPPASPLAGDTAVIHSAATNYDFSAIAAIRASSSRQKSPRASQRRRNAIAWTSLMAVGLLIGLGWLLIPGGTEPAAIALAPAPTEVSNEEDTRGSAIAPILITLLVLSVLTMWLQFLNRLEAQRIAEACRQHPEADAPPAAKSSRRERQRRKHRTHRTRKTLDDATKYLHDLHLA